MKTYKNTCGKDNVKPKNISINKRYKSWHVDKKRPYSKDSIVEKIRDETTITSSHLLKHQIT